MLRHDIILRKGLQPICDSLQQRSVSPKKRSTSIPVLGVCTVLKCYDTLRHTFNNSRGSAIIVITNPDAQRPCSASHVLKSAETAFNHIYHIFCAAVNKIPNGKCFIIVVWSNSPVIPIMFAPVPASILAASIQTCITEPDIRWWNWLIQTRGQRVTQGASMHSHWKVL